ncbi:hypothetical protein AB3N02_22020 [Priestia aryabhattai]|uniref:hypothetical protein n=1 Tax=Priestia aryabhattai TaxID=412384 RepID=UPI0039A3DB01
MSKRKRKKKRKTIGKMTQTRGEMPPPTKKVEDKRKKKDRKQIKEKLKGGDFE